MLHHDNRDAAVAEREAIDEFRERVNDRIARGQPNAEQRLKSIAASEQSIVDYKARVGGRPALTLDSSGGFSLDVPTSPNGPQRPLLIKGAAIMQLAERVSCPLPAVVRDMASSAVDWQKKLAMTVVNEFAMHSEPKTFLIRSAENEAKAILTERYAPWDTWQVAEAFLDSARAEGGVPIRADYDGYVMRLEVLQSTVFPLKTAHNGMEYLSVGGVYQNSSFGRSSQVVAFSVDRIWCTNKAVSRNQLRNVHLGGKMNGDDASDLTYSRRTYQLRTASHMSAVADLVMQLFSADSVQRRLLQVKASGDEVLSIDYVDRLTDRGLTKPELESVKQLLMSGDDRVPRGPLTKWKVGQAVSALANDEEDDGVASARRVDLEELAGSLIFN